MTINPRTHDVFANVTVSLSNEVENAIRQAIEGNPHPLDRNAYAWAAFAAIDINGFEIRRKPDLQGKPLSFNMRVALNDLQEAGKLIRHPGGFWAKPDAEILPHNGQPAEYHGAKTVDALVRRDLAEYVEWKDGRNGRFPIAAALPHPEREGQE